MCWDLICETSLTLSSNGRCCTVVECCCVTADKVCFEGEIIYIQLMYSFPFFPLTLQSLHWLSSLTVTPLLTHYVEELVGVGKGKSILLGQLQQWPVCLGNMHNEITVVSSLLEELGSEVFRFQAYFSTLRSAPVLSGPVAALQTKSSFVGERSSLLPLVFGGLSRVPVFI